MLRTLLTVYINCVFLAVLRCTILPSQSWVEGGTCLPPLAPMALLDYLTSGEPVVWSLTSGEPVVWSLTSGEPVVWSLTSGEPVVW